MSFSQILFGFKGRLARLPYFGYSLLALVLVMLSTFVAVSLIGQDQSGGGAVIGGLLIAAAIIFSVWASLAVTIKRLHDIGMAGTHAIWIYGVGIAASGVSVSSEALGVLFNLVSLGIWLWLLFAPSQPYVNEYGPIPGTQSEDEPAMTSGPKTY